jgi:hypothetical protein
MIIKKSLAYIALVVCCLLLSRGIGNTAESVPELGVNILKGSINGTCFNDVNRDGQFNQGEQGIPGVTVTLRRFSLFGFSFKDVASTETDAEGKYTFSVNKAGIYRIEESDPPGSTSTTPNEAVFFMGLFNTDQVRFFGDILNNSQKPIVSITTDPPVIQKGGSSMLSWSSENADTVTINQGIGEVQAAGTLEVFPLETTTYTIIAAGKNGTAQSSITVTVQNIVITTTTIPNPPPKTTTTTSTGGSHGGGGGSNSTITTTARSTTTTVRSTTSTVHSTTSIITTTTAVTTTIAPITTTTPAITTTTVMQTVIELASFYAVPGDREIKLTWQTETEIDTAGYNIYRAETEDGTYVRVNASLIPAQGSAASGAMYIYTDRDVVNRKTYFYKLEDRDINGAANFHGPVSATPLFMYRIK